MADDNDLPPPLEDMTEVIEKLNAFKTHQGSSQSSISGHPSKGQGVQTETKETTVTSSPSVDKSTAAQTSQQQLKPKETSDQAKDAVVVPSSSAKPSVSSKANSQFGGMNKGFLFGGGNAKKATKKPSAPAKSSDSSKGSGNSASEDMPFIKAQGAKESKLEFPEVQSAMKSTEALLQNKDWVTEDLLEQIQKDPVLAGAFESPHFAKAAAELQHNPQAAMEKYKDSPEMQKFLQAFCKLLGEHFTGLGERQAGTPAAQEAPHIQEVQTSTGPQASAADLAQMQELVSRPEVKEALMDPAIMKLMESLRRDPDEGQRLLQQMTADQRAKVQVLVRNGLLGTQRSE